MRIFISGPITGCKDGNAAAFDAAARRLRATADGFVVNPREIIGTMGEKKEIDDSFRAYYGELRFGGPPASPKLAQGITDATLAAVRSCDAIYMLEGWEKSRGAKKELLEALKLDLDVILERPTAMAKQMTLPGMEHAPHRTEPWQT